MFSSHMTWLVTWVGVLVLLVFAAITGYLEGSGHRILPRPTRSRLPRRDRRMPKITATAWGATRRPSRRALAAASARPVPPPRAAAALPAAPVRPSTTDRVIRGEVVR